MPKRYWHQNLLQLDYTKQSKTLGLKILQLHLHWMSPLGLNPGFKC